MLCRDCRFSLVCWAGRLLHTATGTLCVKCRKFVLNIHAKPGQAADQPRSFRFDCEERPFLQRYYDLWHQQRIDNRLHGGQLATELISDPHEHIPTNTLIVETKATPSVRISECWWCSLENSSRIYAQNEQVIDLDDEVRRTKERKEFEEEARTLGNNHPWSLLPRRKI